MQTLNFVKPEPVTSNGTQTLTALKYERVLMTPPLALKYLKTNTNNRRLQVSRVKRLAIEMENGRWRENTGEVIKISKTGKLIDGQTRLGAIVKSDTSIYLDVAFGCEDDIFDVLDSGRSRSSGDVFYIKGVKMATVIPAIIKAYIQLKNGQGHGSNLGLSLTNNFLLEEFLKKESYWLEVGYKSMSWYGSFNRIISPSQLGSLYALLVDINEEQATDFFNQLATGLNLENNIIGLLRQKLIGDKMSVKQMSVIHRNALIFKTWNFYRKGIEPKLLKYTPAVEGYPVPE